MPCNSVQSETVQDRSSPFANRVINIFDNTESHLHTVLNHDKILHPIKILIRDLGDWIKLSVLNLI